MAAEESINDFIGQEAFKQLTDLKNKIDATAKSMEGLIDQTVEFNDEISNSDSLKNYTKSVEASKKTIEALEKATEQLAQTQTEEAKQIAILQAQTNAANKANRDAAKANLEQVDAYTKLVRAQKEAEREYLNLASAQKVNTKAVEEAAAKNKLLYDQLSKIEQGAGNFRRNVGNYASGFNSFNQVLREAPAFAVNAQTGLLALSNNLPIFADELKNARAAGSSFKDILKGLGASLFGFSGIVVILTTLLTFLPQIIDAMAVEMGTAELATKRFNDALLEANEATTKERVELEALVEIAKSDTASREDKAAAIRQINDILPDHLGNITQENILTAEGARLIEAYNETLAARALATAHMNNIQTISNEILAKQNSGVAENISLWERLSIAFAADESVQDRANKNRATGVKLLEEQRDQAIKNFNTALSTGKAALNLEKTKEQIASEAEKARKDRAAQKEKDEKKRLAQAEKDKKEFARLTKADSIGLDEVKPIENKYREQKNLALDLSGFEIETRKNTNAELGRLNAERVEKETEAKEAAIAGAQELGDTLFNIQNAALDRRKNAVQDEIDALDELTRKQIEQVAESVASEEEKAARIAVIEAQAQAKKEQLEKKQRALDKQKAINEKKKAVFDIVLNTAIAISKALTNPFLIGVIATLGAAQLATVLATPIPEFAKGTDFSPEGPAIVGEKGRELIISPSGRASFTSDGASLTYLEKGSKVIPNHKLNAMALDGLAGITRFTSNATSNDYKLLAKATSESADKITKAIKNQPVTTITEGGLYREHLKAAKLANYLKRNLK